MANTQVFDGHFRLFHSPKHTIAYS